MRTATNNCGGVSATGEGRNGGDGRAAASTVAGPRRLPVKRAVAPGDAGAIVVHDVVRIEPSSVHADRIVSRSEGSHAQHMKRIVLQCGDAVLWGLACALLVWRWCVPVESAARGDTLGITVLWCAAAALAAASGVRWRRESGAYRPWRSSVSMPLVWAADAGLALIVAGHVCGALWLAWRRAGDVRAAINVVAEWLGIGAAWWTFRVLWDSIGAVAALLRRGALLIAVLAGLGAWQHWVWYEQVARSYSAVRQQLDAAVERTGPDSPAARRLQERLLRMGVPPESLYGRARTLFEQRLRDSREPLGFYALANTFAGLLLCGLFWAVLHFHAAEPRAGSAMWAEWIRRGLCWGAVALTLYCLVLTKSRTAWLGSLCGFGWLGSLWLRERGAGPSRARGTVSGGEAVSPAEAVSEAAARARWIPRRFSIAIGVVFVGALLGIAVVTGGVDAEVVWQAPKSVRYRLEYWTATVRMMSEHWLWGIGPGTFQTAYLEYKLPASSEEIADPHNLFLDVWANGGMFGLIGLASVVAAGMGLAWRLLSGGPASGRPMPAECEDDRSRAPVGVPREPSGRGAGPPGPVAAASDRDGLLIPAMAAGILGPAVAEWVSGADWSGQHLAVLFGWLVLAVSDRWLSVSAPAAGASRSAIGRGTPRSGTPPPCGVLRGRLGPLSASVCTAGLAAFLAVFVHLCGAGGIEMPGFAVTWLLCLLAALVAWRAREPEGDEQATGGAADPVRGSLEQRRSVSDAASADSGSHDAQDWRQPCRGRLAPWAAALWALAAVWVWQFAYRPVRTAQRAIEHGDRAWMDAGDAEAARRMWLAAADADPLAVEPWLRIAQLELARAERASSATSALTALQQAERALREALRRDPRRYSTYWELARVYRRRWEWLGRADAPLRGERLATAKREARNAALDAYRRARQRYPTQTELLAEFALFAAAAGDDRAAALAREAITYDRFNRDAGHVDRLLPTQTLQRLRILADSTPRQPD